MGRGIAQVAAQAGISVVVCDVDDAAAQSALAKVRAGLDRALEKGVIDAAARDAAAARVSVATDVARAAAGVDLVIEAVPEVLALKKATFAAAAAAAAPGALLASNTSSLSIGAIAEGLPDPSRVVGMHFFNPVPVMKLCEIVHHAGSAPAAVEAARGLAQRLGKTPIVVRDSPGFASSRLGIALGLEAIRRVEEVVASPADIDTARKLGYGHPMGPLELSDLVGLDVRLAIADYLATTLGERYRAPDVMRAMVDAGKLGIKTGQGFYRWENGKKVG